MPAHLTKPMKPFCAAVTLLALTTPIFAADQVNPPPQVETAPATPGNSPKAENLQKLLPRINRDSAPHILQKMGLIGLFVRITTVF